MEQKVVTFLWYDKEAEEAMNFYVETFKGASSESAKDSEVIDITRYPGGYTEGPMAGMEGKVLNGTFKLGGVKFYALDGGPIFKFTPATSIYVECEDQAEIDYFFEKFSAVPDAEQCGWLQDKYGLSWQIIPKNMGDLLQTKEQIDAMLKMKKIDIAALEAVGK